MLGTFCFLTILLFVLKISFSKINPSIYFSNAINSISRNSWNVINYCDELLAAPSTSPKNYWANTSGNGLILRLLDYELVENWFQEVTRSNTERINRFCMAFPLETWKLFKRCWGTICGILLVCGIQQCVGT